MVLVMRVLVLWSSINAQSKIRSLKIIFSDDKKTLPSLIGSSRIWAKSFSAVRICSRFELIPTLMNSTFDGNLCKVQEFPFEFPLLSSAR